MGIFYDAYPFRMLRLRCCRSEACLELDEGFSMSGVVPFALSVP